MSWVSLLFEAVLAVLMVALIIYCIKLNRRLSTLRDQNAEFADMLTGLNEASERAEQAVRHLKSAGLSAEKSLRSVIEDASAVKVDLSRLVARSSRQAAPPAPAGAPEEGGPERPAPSAPPAAQRQNRENVQRDMLMGEPDVPPGGQGMPPARPKTREEAEETVLQAIRSARAGT